MLKNRAKIFICQHPAGLLLHKNFSRIIRKHDKNLKIILFKVNHPYFLKFNFKLYEEYFDEIIEFDFIHCRNNIISSYWGIYKFLVKIKETKRNLLSRFEEIDLFLDESAWLPTNILLYNLSKEKNIKSITRFTYGKAENQQTKIDKFKTILLGLYLLPFKKHKVAVRSTKAGKFVDFTYREKLPGKTVKITAPAGEERDNLNTLPYPIISNSYSGEKKDMIIIFGDINVPCDYSEYIQGEEFFNKKTEIFFKAIERYYKGYKLYYKPHPADKEKIPLWVDKKKYKIFDNSHSAQMIFDLHNQKIKAVYSFSSSSVVTASFFGIPSYLYYRYICNKEGIEKLDSFFELDNIKSEFLCNISSPEEIGKIDNLERPKLLDINNIGQEYKQLLKI